MLIISLSSVSASVSEALTKEKARSATEHLGYKIFHCQPSKMGPCGGCKTVAVNSREIPRGILRLTCLECLPHFKKTETPSFSLLALKEPGTIKNNNKAVSVTQLEDFSKIQSERVLQKVFQENPIISMGLARACLADESEKPLKKRLLQKRRSSSGSTTTTRRKRRRSTSDRHDDDDDDGEGGSMSSGATIGMICGAVTVFLIIVVVIICCQKKAQKEAQEEAQTRNENLRNNPENASMTDRLPEATGPVPMSMGPAKPYVAHPAPPGPPFGSQPPFGAPPPSNQMPPGFHMQPPTGQATLPPGFA